MTTMEISNNFTLDDDRRALREERVRQLRASRLKQQEERLRKLREAEKQAHERRAKSLMEIRERLAAKHREVEEKRKKAMERRSSNKADHLQTWKKIITGKLEPASPKPNRLAALQGKPGTQFVSMTTSWAPGGRPRSATGRLFGFGSSAPRAICEREENPLRRRTSQQPQPLSTMPHKSDTRASIQPSSNSFLNSRMSQSIHISRPSRLMEMSFVGAKTKFEKKHVEQVEKSPRTGNNLRQTIDNLIRNQPVHNSRSNVTATKSTNLGANTAASPNRLMSQSMFVKTPEKFTKKKSPRQPPDLVISTEGAKHVDSTGNNSPLSPGHVLHHNGLPSSPMLSRDASNNEEELYRAKLAEQRRLAREKRKAAEEAELAEKARLQEIEEQKLAAVRERRKAELAELKRIEELRLREEEEEERRKKDEEERKQKEERERQKAKELQEEKERQEREKLEKLQRQEEEEREMRKKKLELIMSRVKESQSPAGELSPKRPLSPLIVGNDASLPSTPLTSLAVTPSGSLTCVQSAAASLPAPTSPLDPPKFRSPLLQSMLGSGKLSSTRISLPSQTPLSGTISPAETSSSQQSPADETQDGKEKSSSDLQTESSHTEQVASEDVRITVEEVESCASVVEVKPVDDAADDNKNTIEEVEEVSVVSGSTTEEPVIKDDGDDSSVDDSMKIHEDLSDEELPAIEEESESEIAAEEEMG